MRSWRATKQSYSMDTMDSNEAEAVKKADSAKNFTRIDSIDKVTKRSSSAKKPPAPTEYRSENNAADGAVAASTTKVPFRAQDRHQDGKDACHALHMRPQ